MISSNKLYLAVAKYYLETELYDLTLPGYLSNHNEWIPRSDYLGVSARNARRVARELLTGYPAEEIQAAKQVYARFSIERLKEEIKCLQALITHDQTHN